MDSKAFEEVLDKSAGQSTIKEEAEKEESLSDKVQDEHMKEIEKKKESEENFASSKPNVELYFFRTLIPCLC